MEKVFLMKIFDIRATDLDINDSVKVCLSVLINIKIFHLFIFMLSTETFHLFQMVQWCKSHLIFSFQNFLNFEKNDINIL